MDRRISMKTGGTDVLRYQAVTMSAGSSVHCKQFMSAEIEKAKMLAGERYRSAGSELIADIQRAQRLSERTMRSLATRPAPRWPYCSVLSLELPT